jgi:hypothetical protein
VGDSEVEYEVSGWAQDRLERLLGTLVRAGIAFRVERGTLVVHKLYEPRVDALVTSIEGQLPAYDASAYGSPPPPPPPGFPTSTGAPTPAGYATGYPATGYPGYPGVKPKVSGLAIASLVLGILWICGVGSILAVVFGVVSINQINRSEGRTTGKGLAIAGLVLGILGVLLIAAGMIWGEDTTTIGPR